MLSFKQDIVLSPRRHLPMRTASDQSNHTFASSSYIGFSNEDSIVSLSSSATSVVTLLNQISLEDSFSSPYSSVPTGPATIATRSFLHSAQIRLSVAIPLVTRPTFPIRMA
jgi:hypothetical protein